MSKNISKFKSVTIFVLATNETDLLRRTIWEIRKNCKDEDLGKIIVVVKSQDCPSFFETKKIIDETTDDKLEVYIQKTKIRTDLLLELPEMVVGSHFLVMAADLETDPKNISVFIEKAKAHPERIICASKWMKESEVDGYGFIHEIGSRLMNNAVAFMFGVKAKDLFSIFQIYPLSVYEKMNYKNAEKLLYEYTLKPLRLGVEYEEIPTVYRARTQGGSNVNYLSVLEMAFKFCATALKLRLTPKRYLNEK